MKAKIVLSVHGIEQLNAVQIADITRLLSELYSGQAGTVPGVIGDVLKTSFESTDLVTTGREISALASELRRFDPRLRVAFTVEEVQG